MSDFRISIVINTNEPLMTVCQVVPAKMADDLFEACQSDSYEKLDSTVKVRNLYNPRM